MTEKKGAERIRLINSARRREGEKAERRTAIIENACIELIASEETVSPLSPKTEKTKRILKKRISGRLEEAKLRKTLTPAERERLEELVEVISKRDRIIFNYLCHPFRNGLTSIGGNVKKINMDLKGKRGNPDLREIVDRFLRVLRETTRVEKIIAAESKKIEK